MPRRAAAAASAPTIPPPPPTPTEINFDLVKGYVNGQLPPEEEPLGKEMRQKIEMFDYVRDVLDGPARDICTIRVYRIVPEIRNEGPPFNSRTKQPGSCIDLVPASQFTPDYIRDKLGGGTLKFWLKSKMDRLEFEQTLELPWAPRIYPWHKLIHPEDAKFCVMVDADNRPLGSGPVISHNGAGAARPLTNEDIPTIIEKATAAAKTGNDANVAALESGMNLVTTAASKSIEILAENVKKNIAGGGDSSEVQQLRSEMNSKITELTNAIKDQRIAKLEAEIVALREERAKPATDDIRTAGNEMARELGVEGGWIGLAKAAIGGGEGKEKQLMDYIGEGIGQAIKTWGGDIIMGWREWMHLRRLETQRGQPGNSPAPPTSGAQQSQRPAPAITPAATPGPSAVGGPAAKPPEEMTEEEMINELTHEITSTILHFVTEMDTLDGQGVAVIIKDKYRQYLPFITQLEIFQDVNKLIAFCRNNDDLKDFAASLPEADFVEFVQAFFNAFQLKKPVQSVGAVVGGPGAA